MKKEDGTERRRHERVSMSLDMEVSLLSAESNGSPMAQACRGRDISGGGVSFFTNSQFQPESLLRLRISFDPVHTATEIPSEKMMKVMGKVMWSRKNSESDNYITGVEFLNIYDDDFRYLIEYVNKNVSG